MNRRNFFLSLTSILTLSTISRAEEETPTAVIIRAKCVGCGDCVRICPVSAISLSEGKATVDRETCIGCRMCVRTCSFGAPRI